ncbi:unnamed protein product, partial [Microthlaspi erraticum]
LLHRSYLSPTIVPPQLPSSFPQPTPLLLSCTVLPPLPPQLPLSHRHHLYLAPSLPPQQLPHSHSHNHFYLAQSYHRYYRNHLYPTATTAGPQLPLSLSPSFISPRHTTASIEGYWYQYVSNPNGRRTTREETQPL